MVVLTSPLRMVLGFAIRMIAGAPTSVVKTTTWMSRGISSAPETRGPVTMETAPGCQVISHSEPATMTTTGLIQ